jgi:hypothetical protein
VFLERAAMNCTQNNQQQQQQQQQVNKETKNPK